MLGQIYKHRKRIKPASSKELIRIEFVEGCLKVLGCAGEEISLRTS